MLITTPPVVLVLALVGFGARVLSVPLRLFLGVAIAVAIGRNVPPGMRNFDGVRHFLEFYPFLCIAAGAGLAATMARVRRLAAGRAGALAAPVVALLCLAAPVVATARTHPNGICYFNALVGGLGGAQALGISGATDYWGNAYWQAFAVLNARAEPGARVLVPVGTQVGRSIAPVRLRRDLELWRYEPEPPQSAVWVTYVTRRGWYSPFVRALERERRPAFELSVQGGVIVRTFRLDPACDAELLALWRRRFAVRENTGRIWRYLRGHPEGSEEAWDVLISSRELGIAATAARLRALLPTELHEGLEDVLAAWSDER